MNQSLPAAVKEAMESFQMAPGTTRILCGVSGGADSVCLLLVLRQLGYEVCAAHVEHGIRGEESLEDGAFVRRLCAERKIPFCMVSVDVPAAARERSLTLEEAAREERWRALKERARAMGISVIAAAHQRMDQAETVLWNLVRGSSVSGLSGIRPLRREGDLTLIRPLLDCERGQIEAYLRQQKVSWRTDSTNADTAITRNAIRLKILPLLRELNPEAEKHMALAAGDLRKTEEWLREQTDAAWERVIVKEGAGTKPADRLMADCEALERCPEVIRHRLLHRMIAQLSCGAKDIARVHVLSLEHLALGRDGHALSLPGGLTAFREEGIVHLSHGGGWKEPPRTEEAAVLEEDGTYQFPDPVHGRIEARVEYITWQGAEVPKKKYTKYLAYDTMAPCLVLRTRRSGDYLIVNAASGRKKLKDYLIDEKVPRSLRDRIPLIAQGSHVLWVIGMRISEGAKVTEGMRCACVTVSSEGKDLKMPG